MLHVTRQVRKREHELTPSTPDHSNGTSMAPVIEMKNVVKEFGDFRALDGVSLDIEQGEIVSVIGGSGSGKTTLLRCLVGLEEITSGQIYIDGELVVDGDIARDKALMKRARAVRRAKLGMVFQSFNLFPHRTALENVTEGPIHVLGVDSQDAEKRALELLDTVGLSDRAGHYPAQLSGGQQQRVAIARALAMDPEVILFDEVTSALDPELTAEVLEVMTQLARSGQTMFVVTHEMGFARRVGSRVIYMDEGKVVEEGAPDAVLLNPRHDRTREFLSKVLQLGEN